MATSLSHSHLDRAVQYTAYATKRSSEGTSLALVLSGERDVSGQNALLNVAQIGAAVKRGPLSLGVTVAEAEETNDRQARFSAAFEPDRNQRFALAFTPQTGQLSASVYQGID